MFKTWTDTLVSAPTMCFGPRPDGNNHEFPEVDTIPSSLRNAVVADVDNDDDDDDVMSCGSSVHLEYAPSFMPPQEIRVPSPAPTTPVRDPVSPQREPPSPPRRNALPMFDSEPRLMMLPESPTQSAEEQKPSFIRPSHRVSYYPMSPSQTLKRANPLDAPTTMKDYYDKSFDDETVSTAASTIFAPSNSFASSESDNEEHVNIEWRKRSNSFINGTDDEEVSTINRSSRMQLSWSDAVVEETEEGFKIHAPPELLRFPVLMSTEEEEEEWAYETPPPRLAPRSKVVTSECAYRDDDDMRGLCFETPSMYLPGEELCFAD
mmetsp:Transcript_12247/g.17960  ORF Transcript_12247/g.17960 Transcript_12247/m.17960 type:complete len:320 (-) Transcript_12247:235-1194(-)